MHNIIEYLHAHFQLEFPSETFTQLFYDSIKNNSWGISIYSLVDISDAATRKRK